MYIYWFSSGAVTYADDDDNAGRHSTTTRATYRQQSEERRFTAHDPIRLAVTKYSTLSSDGMKSVEMRSDEVRWGEMR